MTIPAKTIIRLPRPMPGQYNCLPHAAMNLGGRGGVGLQPAVRMVSTLTIEPQMGAWVFYRLDADGGYVEDSWHPTREDALHQASREFGIEVGDV
jgi:hypothetical protein